MTIQHLLRDLLGPPATSAQPARQRLGLVDCGELVELLAKPTPTRCPHCDKQQPAPKLRTRRRRLYALRNAAGDVLHLEIEP